MVRNSSASSQGVQLSSAILWARFAIAAAKSNCPAGALGFVTAGFGDGVTVLGRAAEGTGGLPGGLGAPGLAPTGGGLAATGGAGLGFEATGGGGLPLEIALEGREAFGVESEEPLAT